MTETQHPDLVFISKITAIVTANLGNESFGVKELSQHSGMSRSAINRRLKRTTSKSINQFIREVRLLKSLELLKNEELTAAEVSYKVGFSRPSYFNTCFHSYFGYPPGKVKKGLAENDEDPLTRVFSVRSVKDRLVWKRLNYYKARILVLSILIVILFVLAYHKYFISETLDDLRSNDGKISVAVMPFQNTTDNKSWDYVQINLISYLSNFGDLKVREKNVIINLLQSKGLADFASLTPSEAGDISKKLDANVFVTGGINKSGSIIRLNAQLINSRTKVVIRSFVIDGHEDPDQIFKTIDSLSVLVKNFLVKSKLEEELTPDLKPYKFTDSPEAFKNFILAEDALSRNDISSSLYFYSRAVAADSNFIPAIIFLSMRYSDIGRLYDAKKWCLKAYEKRDRANIKDRVMVNWYHATLFEKPEDEIEYLRQYITLDDQVPIAYYQMGEAYLKLFQYNKAIPEFKKALEIYKKWGIKPMMVNNYTKLIYAYRKTEEYAKVKRLLKKAEKDFPDKLSLIYWQKALLMFAIGDTINANKYVEKYSAALKDLTLKESSIKASKALLYLEAGMISEAEKGITDALSMDPDNPVLMNKLAILLIDEDMNINRGLDIVEKALVLEPDNYSFLYTKGMGLLKSGKPEEALEYLQKSWDLKPYYNHNIFLRLEEVKNAVSF
jgi:AraC-like DNA-binding protein/tetratricopeptide (TPR) repeat protein